MNGDPFGTLQLFGFVNFWFIALIVIILFKPERVRNRYLFRLSIAFFIIHLLIGPVPAVFLTVVTGMGGGYGMGGGDNGLNQMLSVYGWLEIGKGLAIGFGILALFASLSRGGRTPKQVKAPAPPKKHPLDE